MAIAYMLTYMTLQLLTAFSYCLKTFFSSFSMINNILVNIFVQTTLSTFYLTWIFHDFLVIFLEVRFHCMVCFAERKKKKGYLIAQVHISISAEEQWHHVHVSFLSCKMDGSNSLPGNCICISTIFQQSCRYVHLVLFGSDVQWRITILSTQITWSHVQSRDKNVCTAFSNSMFPFLMIFFDRLKNCDRVSQHWEIKKCY